jgi:hypothetical protein
MSKPLNKKLIRSANELSIALIGLCKHCLIHEYNYSGHELESLVNDFGVDLDLLYSFHLELEILLNA